jgi:glycosyltransferase involved in cell wall biosynthesis
MDGKIRVLFYNLDGAGVNYFRTLTPAMELERNHSEDFYVEINPQIDFNDPKYIDYLKTFHIIHYHRQFLGETQKMIQLANELRKAGTILIVDIDDYWKLHRQHPFYIMSQEKKLHIPIIENLKIADYVTTTTDLFASEIRTITGKDNVEVFYNSVDPIWMKQFQNNWKPDPDGLVRITYMAGSSHLGDMEQLEGVMNVLSNDINTRNKFKVIISGWDTEGNTTDITFNQEFGDELQKRGLWTPQTVKAINNSRGNVDIIPKLPIDLKEKYRNNVFNQKQRDIKSVESVYLIYEKILTDNHHMIKNPDYLQWLMNFERNVKYENEGNFGRRWTQKANTYAQVLDETDIVIAPLANNPFNKMKSNLKQVECWTRKLPIVCSDIPPYNVHGKHMENCVLIPMELPKNARKYWVKYLKRLILDADLRKKLGEQLYEDFKVEYSLKNVTQKRAEFYKAVVAKTLVVI